jgi:hypothetical protein
MGRTEDKRLRRIETRLVRLREADEALSLLTFRLGQIAGRAPYLRELIGAASADALEALALVREEFDDTQRERVG